MRDGQLRPLLFSGDGAAGDILLSAPDLFSTEPGVGFAIVDIRGVLRYANRRWAELMAEHGQAAHMIGRSLDELFGATWAEERISALRQVVTTRRPVALRHIRRGCRLQSTLRLLSRCDERDEPCIFSVVTSVGIHAIPENQEIDVIESEVVHLGPLDALSPRELEVLALIGQGQTSSRIGKTLHRSVRTVEQHSASIRRKLALRSRTEMAAIALRAGLTLEDAGKTRVASVG